MDENREEEEEGDVMESVKSIGVRRCFLRERYFRKNRQRHMVFSPFSSIFFVFEVVISEKEE